MSIARQILSGDMVMVLKLASPRAGEERLSPIGAGPIDPIARKKLNHLATRLFREPLAQ
jgi:hypothetical protein